MITVISSLSLMVRIDSLIISDVRAHIAT